MNEKDEAYMRLALAQAALAAEKDEVPVGAVVVWQDQVIAQAHNLREREKDPCAHAELLAIRQAAKRLGGWRLLGCTLYVTLEPCPMCAGAMINARLPRLVYGATDPKAGALGSKLDLNALGLNHKMEVVSGICQQECAQILTNYFSAKRKKIKKREMKMEGKKGCSCTYPGCPRHGNCRACVQHHVAEGGFTACFFSKEAEKTYDRSFDCLLKDRGIK